MGVLLPVVLMGWDAAGGCGAFGEEGTAVFFWDLATPGVAIALFAAAAFVTADAAAFPFPDSSSMSSQLMPLLDLKAPRPLLAKTFLYIVASLIAVSIDSVTSSGKTNP